MQNIQITFLEKKERIDLCCKIAADPKVHIYSISELSLAAVSISSIQQHLMKKVSFVALPDVYKKRFVDQVSHTLVLVRSSWFSLTN